VGFDRCGFSPNGLEGVLCLLNFFFIVKEKIERLRIQEEQDAASAIEELFARCSLSPWKKNKFKKSKTRPQPLKKFLRDVAHSL
jgi:hypothetical protein